MTTFEHALLGVNGALACGLHRRHGWRVVVLAGFAAIAPDWDGLPMLVDMARFESAHRVWGHNVLACLITGLLIGTLDFRLNLCGRFVEWLTRISGKPNTETLDPSPTSSREFGRWLTWVTVAFVAALSQIPADAIVSGGTGLTDWALRPLWPFSGAQWVCPLVPWGNVGITLIFAFGMILMARNPRRVQGIAIITLSIVGLYAVIWGNWIRDRDQELGGIDAWWF